MSIDERYIGKRVIVRYDPCDCIDEDDTWVEWENFKLVLDGILHQKNPDGYYRVEAKNLGWNRRSGYKYAEINRASDLVNALGIADSTIEVRRYHNKGLFIRAKNHDNPVNGDEYYLIPVAESTYRRATC